MFDIHSYEIRLSELNSIFAQIAELGTKVEEVWDAR